VGARGAFQTTKVLIESISSKPNIAYGSKRFKENTKKLRLFPKLVMN
jgi:hypothetical protein